jgi:hypothetical protein
MVFIVVGATAIAQTLHSPARDTLHHVSFIRTTTISEKNWIVRVCYELNRQLTKDERGGWTRSRLLSYIKHKKRPNSLQTQLSNWEDAHGRK